MPHRVDRDRHSETAASTIYNNRNKKKKEEEETNFETDTSWK